MPKTKHKQQTEVEAVDIFGGIFSLLRIRDYESLNPYRLTNRNYYAYDEACIVVSRRVNELCTERGDYCAFCIVVDTNFGNSPNAFAEILFWQSCRRLYKKLHSNSRDFFFCISKSQAESILLRCMYHTGYTRVIFEELTDLFESIYKED